jgi:hypothetical protein
MPRQRTANTPQCQANCPRIEQTAQAYAILCHPVTAWKQTRRACLSENDLVACTDGTGLSRMMGSRNFLATRLDRMSRHPGQPLARRVARRARTTATGDDKPASVITSAAGTNKIRFSELLKPRDITIVSTWRRACPPGPSRIRSRPLPALHPMVQLILARSRPPDKRPWEGRPRAVGPGC